MRPLEPLSPVSPIARMLRSAPVNEVSAELDRLAALTLDPLPAAALMFARGALRLREGALTQAHDELDAASAELLAEGEIEAGLLARCEVLLARIRRGPRSVYAGAIDALDSLLDTAEHKKIPRVAVVALHYRGTAERLSGDALATQRTLLDAFQRSEPASDAAPLLDERAQILNSLGTLYVVLGAYGAAQALLEHAAELACRLGDAVGEAIAHGQLGAAALATGDLDRARRHLQKQEWLASRSGDVFGRTRALTFLADVALDAGRPDEAAELAELAMRSAASVDPPLTLWSAYAARALGRARMDVGDTAEARVRLEAARTGFTQFGNPLGQALVDWDLARLASDEARAPGHEEGASPPDWFAPAWALGSLGLGTRVARLLADRRRTGGVVDLALAASAQSASHLAVAQEIELIYSDPTALAAIASCRNAAQRNLGRLAALTLAPTGLLVAAVASSTIGGAHRALPPERGAGAALLEIPGAAVWGFPLKASIEEVGRDLAALRAALGPDARAVLVARPSARVLAPPFPGELGASLEGVDAAALITAACALDAGILEIAGNVAWTPEAEARARMAGFTVRPPAS
jgi:tetratricopeptide (TPR) repeat protein